MGCGVPCPHIRGKRYVAYEAGLDVRGAPLLGGQRARIDLRDEECRELARDWS